MTDAEGFSAKQVAMKFNTNARTFRKFLREYLPKDNQPGHGARYMFQETQLSTLKAHFDTWSQPTPTELPDDQHSP